MSELKAICVSQLIEVVGDKRSKSTYILAIKTFHSEQTVIEMPPILDPFENQLELASETESIDLPPTSNTKHSASIVVLIPLIFLSLAIISIRVGIGALIPFIASLKRFTGAIGQSVPRTLDPGSIPIHYSPM